MSGKQGIDFGSIGTSGFAYKDLIKIVQDATVSARTKLLAIKASGSSVSIGDMFEMQMFMNHLSQLSEMSASVVSAANTAINSMASKVSR